MACKQIALVAVLVWLSLVETSTAQKCDGFEVSAMAGELRCVMPGAGESFREADQK